MDQISAKRRRLANVEGLLEIKELGISHAAWARMLSQISTRPDVLQSIGGMSTEDIRKSVACLEASSILDVQTTVELPLIKGSVFKWPILSVKGILQKAIDISTLFRDALQALLAVQAPLQIVLYTDELTPGNVLRPDNRRKCTVFYFSLLGLGHLLRLEQMWFTAAVLQSNKLKQISGGLSVATSLLLEEMLGCAAANTRFTLKISGRPHQTNLELHNLIADEDALHKIFSSKGATSIRPCLLCKNVLKFETVLHDYIDKGYFTNISESSVQKFDQVSNHDLYAVADNLQREFGQMRQTEFEDLQKASGFKFFPQGLLWHPPLRRVLRPASILTYDPMHCFFSCGIVINEMDLFLRFLKRSKKISFGDMASLLKASWKHDNNEKNLADIFNPTREKYESFKASASEALGVYPFILHVAEIAYAGQEAPDELRSFRQLSEVLRWLNMMKRKVQIASQDCEELQRLQERHLSSFKQAYGISEVKPKNHFSLHLPEQICRNRYVLDCFVLERKHRAVKKMLTNVCNLAAFESSSLASVHAHEMKQLQTAHLQFKSRLVGRTKPATQLSEALGSCCMCACSVSWSDRGIPATLCNGDVISTSWGLGSVQTCAMIDDVPHLVVQRYTKTGTVGAAMTFASEEGSFLLNLSKVDVQRVAHWSVGQDGTLLVLPS